MFRIYLFVILSILLHLMMYWGADFVPPFQPQNLAKDAIEFEIKESDDTAQARELVRQVNPPEPLDSPLDQLKEKAKLLSEKTQRVKKQSQAKLFGISENQSTRQQAQQQATKKHRRTVERDLSQAAEPEEKSIEDLMRQGGIPRPSAAPSRVSQQIDNVAFGDVTALNTDRHLFYTYYARIEDSIRWIWEREISQAMQGPLQINGSSAKENWKTRIDIILDKEGRYERVALLKSSGIPDFDRAVETAFLAAKTFPNPPIEMIGIDGKIRLKYVFEVYFRPKILARP